MGPSGLDKRMATMHPTIRARGSQFVPCWIIFKGAGNITPAERQFLDSLENIKWAFQAKVYLRDDRVSACVYVSLRTCVLC